MDEDCMICYETYKNHNLISFGCCSLRICKRCTNSIQNGKCPQCKKLFFFDSILENQIKQMEKELREELEEEFDERLDIETIELFSEITNLKTEIGKLKTKLGDLSLAKLKEELNFRSQIHNLTNTIYMLNYNLANYDANKEVEEKELERVILKYHLNIV